MGDFINMVDPVTGDTHSVPSDRVGEAMRRGWTQESTDSHDARLVRERREAQNNTAAGALVAGATGFLRGATLGLSDLAINAAGAGEQFGELREDQSLASLGGEALGSFTGLGKLAQGAGSAIAKTGEGAGVLTKLGRAAAGGATEGAIFGAGSGVSELALSDDPITAERAASVLSSHAMFGAGVGAGAGLLAKGVEVGLQRAKSGLEGIAERSAAPEAAEDLARLDMKGLRTAERTERESLRAAEKTEIESLKKAEQSEIEALEKARATQRSEVADEIRAFRQQVKDQKHFLTTEGVSLPAVEGRASAAEIGRTAAKSMKQLDSLLDNPVGMAQNPTRALDALQRHEASMTKLLDRADDLRAVFRADESGIRAAALDTIPAAIEKNRALQKRLMDLAQKPTSERLAEIAARREAIAGGAMRTSQRLDDIAAARDAMAGGSGSMIGNMLGGTVFGGVSSFVGSIPVLGQIPGLASMAGAKAAQFVNGGLSRAVAAQAGRTAKAVGMVLDVTKRAQRVAPVLATKVLSQVAFSPEAKPVRGLAAAYKARTEEIKRLTQFTPDGKTEMRPEARVALGKRLDPIRPIAPMLADALETIQARKVEYLSSIIPRRPEVGWVQAGPDRWQPSSMEMRSFARSVAAVEDPGAVFERVAGGTVTPEDKDAVKNVYPELYADFQRQVFEQMATLRKSLPYQKRLALSIFSDVPVDPSMHPAVLAVLQSTFANEKGSDGGTMAPTPQPQFGSVKSEAATPAQERAG